jgi:signal transduction histidine kinase
MLVPNGGAHAAGADGGTAYERLARLALDLGAVQQLGPLYRRLRDFVSRETPPSGMFVSSYDSATRLRRCVYAFSEGEEIDSSTFPLMPDTGSPHSRAVATGETILTQDFQEAMTGKPRFNVGLDRDPRLPQSSIVVPMMARGRILGAMEIQSVRPDAFRPEHVSTLQLAAHLAALAAWNVEALEGEKALRVEHERRAMDLEAKVRERVRELAAKNRELEAFSFTVAHDLRAPLRAILNLSEELLKRNPAADPGTLSDLDAIHISSMRMADLVEDLLRFARTSQGAVRRELVDMTSLARAILAGHAAHDPKRLARIEVQDNLFVEADAALVRILLDNLVGNAWKYSGRAPATHIHVGAKIRDDEVVYYVEDHGVGFDPAQSSRLFAAFQRLHPANEYEGTGIGLATAQRIVERHGGRIWAESGAGGGATFFFTLQPPRRRESGP